MRFSWKDFIGTKSFTMYSVLLDLLNKLGDQYDPRLFFVQSVLFVKATNLFKAVC